MNQRFAIDPATDPPTVVPVDTLSTESLRQFNLSYFSDIAPKFPTQGVAEAIREHRFARTAIDRMQAEWQLKREMRGDAFKRVPRKRGRR